jgi:hypothetical protein
VENCRYNKTDGSRWIVRQRTGVLAGDGGEYNTEVALGERAPAEQSLQQGVVPLSPRQRHHGPLARSATDVGVRETGRKPLRDGRREVVGREGEGGTEGESIVCWVSDSG